MMVGPYHPSVLISITPYKCGVFVHSCKPSYSENFGKPNIFVYMELNLFPQMANTTIFEGEGGGYYSWTATAIAKAELAAGKLVLQPRGFAPPHYSDAYKIGYVLQGECSVGIISPNSPQEDVLIIRKGDAIPVVMGSISWWFNGGDSDVTIIFLGESSRSYNPGQFDYFFLTGAIGVLGGFSAEFISKIYGFSESQSQQLTKSQPNAFIFKVDEEIKMPTESNCKIEDYIFKLENLISNDLTAEMTAENFPLLEKTGLSAGLVRLEPGSASDPSYNSDGSRRIVYVTKGSGRVQIVGLNGTRVLDADVAEGQVFVVPSFLVVAELAGENGMEFFSVATSARPIVGKLGGNASPYKMFSSTVLQVGLNVSPELVNLFKSKLN